MHAPPDEPSRRLTRRANDRVLGGVAGGLGDYFNIDPAIFRLAFIALMFFGASGLVLYVLGWLFVPERTTGQSLGEDLIRRVGGGRPLARWTVIIIAAVVIINAVSAYDGGLLWAVLLIAAGVWFFRHEESSTATDTTDELPTVTPSPTPPPPAPNPVRRTAPPQTEPSAAFDDWRPTPIVAPPEPPPPPSVLGRITVAAALMLGGLVALIQNVTSLHVSVDHYAALGLTIVGAGLVVGARLGRSHGLIALGIILVAVMAVAATLPDISPTSSAGQQTWTPLTVAELRDRYELGMGELELDLTELALEPGQQVTVAASVGLGQLVVDVPPNTTIDLDASSRVGDVVAFDLNSEGTNATIDHVRRGPEGSPTIALDLAVGMGEVQVLESSVAADPSEGASTDTTADSNKGAAAKTTADPSEAT